MGAEQSNNTQQISNNINVNNSKSLKDTISYMNDMANELLKIYNKDFLNKDFFNNL